MIEILNENAIRALANDLNGFAREMTSRGRLRTLLEDIRDDIIIPEFEDQFLRGGNPSWPPVSPTTLRRRKQGGGASFNLGGLSFIVGGTPPLTDTGQFKRAAAAKARFKIKRNQMTYGSFPGKMWWAIPIHEQGQANSIPQRSWAGQTMRSPEVQDEIVDATWDWVRDRIDSTLTRRRYF